MRHKIDWTSPDFTNPAAVDQEMRRVFDICNGCRLCFNLCDSFPRLFDLADASPTGEIHSIESKDFASVVDACTLCDLCFITKCPYTPPHEYALDVPHLMLRYRALEFSQGKVSGIRRLLARTDLVGKMGNILAPLANWAVKRSNKLTRSILNKLAHIHPDAALPSFEKKSHQVLQPANKLEKVAIYATCHGNHHDPKKIDLLQRLLTQRSIGVEIVYPGCCGMPILEQGDLKAVSQMAVRVSTVLIEWIQKGYRIVAPVPSCALMLRSEWPLLLPDDENIKLLSQNTSDMSAYLLEMAKKYDWQKDMAPISETVSLHLACHARAQNQGPKATELLRLIPDLKLNIIDRCSGHGGAWGIMQENFDIALKVGKPVAQDILKKDTHMVLSECPLAATHIQQGMEKIDPSFSAQFHHPLELFARSLGIIVV